MTPCNSNTVMNISAGRLVPVYVARLNGSKDIQIDRLIKYNTNWLTVEYGGDDGTLHEIDRSISQESGNLRFRFRYSNEVPER